MGELLKHQSSEALPFTYEQSLRTAEKEPKLVEKSKTAHEVALSAY